MTSDVTHVLTQWKFFHVKTNNLTAVLYLVFYSDSGVAKEILGK